MKKIYQKVSRWGVDGTCEMLSGVARKYLARSVPLRAAFTRRALSCSPLRYESDKLRVAIIGQSLFGLEVYKHLRVLGHEVAGVFTIPGTALHVRNHTVCGSVCGIIV